MNPPRSIWLVISALAIAWAIPAAASACPCSEFCGPVVDHGSSLYGVPWHVTAIREPAAQAPRHATFGFSIGACGEYNEAGYFTSLALPVPRGFTFTASIGGEIDSHPEGDVSGITGPRVVRLTATMSQGEPVTVSADLAPKRLWKDSPWLRRLRFYDLFFPAEAEPLAITGFDRYGHVLDRQKLSR